MIRSHKSNRRYSTLLCLVSFWVSANFFGMSASALELKPSEIRAKTTEKPVAVLQKRFFVKTMRPEIGLLSGGFLNEAFTNTEKRGVRLALFFTEWMGLEYQYIDTSVSSSQDKKALDQLKFKPFEPAPGQSEDELVRANPEINRIYSVMDLSLVATPFYGKMNLLDWIIVYMDTYLVLGAAQLDTDQDAKTAIATGIGQRYYFFKSFSFRIDFRNHSFTEKRAGKNASRNQQSWDIGFSWFFL
jgi:outer membrane beta-barrel protein